MATSLELTITEQQILHLLIEHPEYLENSDDLLEFSNDTATELYGILIDLQAGNFEINSAHIVTHSRNKVSPEVLQAVLDTEYQTDKYEFYVESLRRFSLYENLRKLNFDLNKELIRKERDLDRIEELGARINSLLKVIREGKSYDSQNFYEAILEHEDVLRERALGNEPHIGCQHFQDLIEQVLPGILTIVAQSGSGKTTILTYLAMQRLVKRLPTIIFNSELSKSALLDNYLAPMMGVPYYDLIHMGQEGVGLDYDVVSDRLEILKKRFIDRDNFLFYPKSSFSAKDIEVFARNARKRMGLPDNQILVALVDLLSMTSDFASNRGGNKANVIEDGIDILNEVCLSNNILLIGSIQVSRQANKNIRIEREEDLNQFIPTLEGIKNSGAYQERSRYVIGVYSPYNIVRSHPSNEVLKNLIPPISELHILKNTFGSIGKKIQYLFDPKQKLMVPYVEENNQ